MLAGVDGGGTTAAEAIERLLAAQIELRNGRRLEKAPTRQLGLKQRLKTLTHPALLVVDEIGYLSVTPNGARLFFQLVNSRYGCASTVPTSNKGFEHWGEILHDEVMPAALLDRLLHRCHIVNIRGNSYRMRRHMELSKAIHPLAGRIDAESLASGEGPS